MDAEIERWELARELGRGVVVLGLTGSSIGGLLAALAVAARVLGR
jgi:hypothetical protein